jgi:hypothetical protein
MTPASDGRRVWSASNPHVQVRTDRLLPYINRYING